MVGFKYVTRPGSYRPVSMGVVLGPWGKPGSGRAVRGLCHPGELNCKDTDPTGRFWGWRRSSGRNARGEAPSSACSSRPAAAESAAEAGHSPWRSLEPWAAALQRRWSRQREVQLHLWAAVAAAKPGNILAGQRPPLGHHLLPPRRRGEQLTP